ncbi:MAG: LamG domain-containing protein, partial [Desulfamplus sp.]|nr:LamG domain-containing protein [Desulfamplus sp.]
MKTQRFMRVLMIMVMASLSLIVTAQADLNDGLVAYYPFNGNANDESGKGHHGTVTGATLTADRNGKANSAYSFDGVDDYIFIGKSSNMNIGNNFTISVWYNVKVSSQKPLIEWNNLSGSFPSGVHIWTNVHYSGWPPGGGTGANIVDTSSASHVIKTQDEVLNIWRHLVITYEKSYGQSRLYLDGILKETENLGSFVPQTTFDLYLGRRPAPDPFYLDGYIDDIRIYNRALSETEIQTLYNDNEQPSECLESELNAKYEAGKQFCIDNPTSCGISTGDGGYTVA